MNVHVTLELHKMGRQVTEIRFKLQENLQLAMLNIDGGEAVSQGPD